MNDKFSKEDINEIISKIEWKPNYISYTIMYLVVFLTIFNLCLLIYFIILNCKLKYIQKKIKKIETNCLLFSNISNNLKENLENNSNEIRYLTKRSEKNIDNISLSDKIKNNSLTFSNEIENNKLFSALNGF